MIEHHQDNMPYLTCLAVFMLG